MTDCINQFERRKKDHIQAALDPRSQAGEGVGFRDIELIHEALPGIDFAEIRLEREFLGRRIKPLFVSSMTAGHSEALEINLNLAKACQKHQWILGVGSQRRELDDAKAGAEWQKIREQTPDVFFVGNIGLTQVIQSSVASIEKLVISLGASALFVHTNPLQECLQLEGTPHFRGDIEALSKLAHELSVPVILKETGCGFSSPTLQRLNGTGLKALDISGYGGTHWGRVEGLRSAKGSPTFEAAESFAQWGIPTVRTLMEGCQLDLDYELWASGGVRTGVDAAKALALGALMAGFAVPLLKAAQEGSACVEKMMERLEWELKIALFCTGCTTPLELKEKKVWRI